DCVIDIGIAQNDERVLATHLQRNFLQMPGGLHRDQFTDLRGAGEGDHPTRGSLSNTAPTSRAGPGTTFSTPGGNPADSKSSAIFSPITGVSSEGFNTKQLPAASASATFFIANSNGALKGAMPPITPSG